MGGGYNRSCGSINQMRRAPTNSDGYEICSLRCDLRAGSHGQDYRGFYLFIIDFLSDSGCAIRARDVISAKNETATREINVFVAHGSRSLGGHRFTGVWGTYVLPSTFSGNLSALLLGAGSSPFRTYSVPPLGTLGRRAI